MWFLIKRTSSAIDQSAAWEKPLSNKTLVAVQKKRDESLGIFERV